MGNNQGQPDGNNGLANNDPTQQANNGAVAVAPDVNAVNPVPPIPVHVPIRDFRPRRFIYNRAQKERAVRLLNMGIPCRQVARMIGPRCSSGSPIRWRQQARRQAEARRRLDEMMRNRGGLGQRF